MNKPDYSAKLAVLIDADNAPADIIDALLEEIAKYGIASVKRIYGDWSSGLNKWKTALLPHAITPVQQFAYTKGKNATDMALVIDAMDLLYSNTFDGFCIVSSDSDFTRLASRIRENGLTVYGFGEKKTPESFRKACDKFIYTEIFRPGHGKPENAAAKTTNAPKASDESGNLAAIDKALINLLYKALKESADDSGWAGLGAIGSYVNKVNSDFDARNYGFSKLSDLIKSLDIFETQTDGSNQLKLRKRAKSSDKAADSAPAAKTSATKAGTTAKPAPRTAAKKTDTPPKPSFSKLIPVAQSAVDACANAEGWANILSVAKKIKQLEPAFDPKHYGHDTAKAVLHAVYSDWLEFEKKGRSEFVRNVGRFVRKQAV